jgi:hypothetical protein
MRCHQVVVSKLRDHTLAAGAAAVPVTPAPLGASGSTGRVHVTERQGM